MDRKGSPIPLLHPLDMHAEAIDPLELWNSIQTWKKVHKQNLTALGTGPTNSTTIDANVPIMTTATSPIMEHHIEVRHPEGSSIATVKELLDNPHIQLGMMQSALSVVTSLFTPSKLIPSAGSDGLVATSNALVGSTPTNVETSDTNRELSTYKDRLTLELTNFKKQLETQSCIEVECAKQNLKSEFDHELRHQTLTQTKMINALRQKIDQLGAQLQQQQVATCPLFSKAPPQLDVTLPPQAPLHHYKQMMSPPAGSLVEVMDVLNRSMTN